MGQPAGPAKEPELPDVPDDEDREVHAWRVAFLVELGFTLTDARAVARSEVPLTTVRHWVRDLGCPPAQVRSLV